MLVDMGGFEPPEPPVCRRCGQATWEARGGRLCEECCQASDRASAAMRVVPEFYKRCRKPEDLIEAGMPERKVQQAALLVGAQKLVIHAKQTGMLKSTLAGWMLRQAMKLPPKERPHTGYWLSAHDLVGSRRELDDEWMYSTLVVLDSLGDEQQMATSLVPKFLEYRSSRPRLRLWITTQLTREEVGKRYGAHIERRVYDHAYELPLTDD